ncbi:energy-coupling factor ABC transporter ATP-binding protein [Paenibacillus mucilaginosus]|uniref:Cobalt transport protein ATP-binding subunit n=1 Tax=Paenibacillus mucilaginosus (strain KNP414) TaxID=1036673 RepID=F8FDF3_PAEMK|nr:ABC transporter ATP-binding protein [Paenibacillus mucilaginosus]AEI42123.1 Cobalt transport protein ATP-binding subunit [Paenibacillus mucilaginosus KNP414]MCG7214104.1 energy-coupling factor ABC transporter ATP-binding protein [Paenibacillus mucilaginosus]WDM28626.1 ABC transporter ATP-binding protein [Paenibacillus mucilaginosus]
MRTLPEHGGSDVPPPLLEARALAFSYPGTRQNALHGLTLSIASGRKTAICGHNGSGKSTFLLHAVGIHRPAAGQLLWKGQPVSYQSSALREWRQRAGLVFQDPEHQLILNTPYEDITYGLRNAGIPEAEIRRRTGAILESMGLTALADTPIHHLSLGQKKRAALAGVLVLEPELLLLDEPTAYLDPASEQRLVGELERIHESGVTVVMATHDTNLAYAWADRVLVMDGGRCLLEGTAEEVFSRREDLRSIGITPPLLLELWEALPASVRGSGSPPRSAGEFKRLLAGF